MNRNFVRFAVRAIVLIAIALFASHCSQTATTPTTTATVAAVTTPPTTTPAPAPQPATVPFNIVIGGANPGARASTQYFTDNSGVILGGTVHIASIDMAVLETICHEFGHVAGAYHHQGPGCLYTFYDPTVTGWNDSEAQILTQMFQTAPGTVVAADASTMMRQMGYGDNTVDIANPGLHWLYRVTANVTMSYGDDIAAQKDIMQQAADGWAGKYGGFSMTLVYSPTKSSAAATSAPKMPPGATRVITVD